jgi:6-phosphogluconolactonase (cycloisomerase 2 family)
MAGMTALAARASGLRASVASAESNRPRFAFVGAMERTHAVHVYAIDGTSWRLQQVVASEAPVSLALHPSGRSLYVLNQVSEYRGLPSGSVEAYRVDAETGQLDLLGRQGLSLSATVPRHMAVAPDGKTLVVAVHGGGAYNLLPILADGRVSHVSGIVKETGCGPVAEHQQTAHPQAVLFDSTGKRVITSDMGADRMSVFSLEDGLTMQARHDAPAGSGPRHLALHPGGHLLYIAHALDGSLCGFAYDADAGRITEEVVHLRGACSDALAMHPTGDYLYAAGNGEVTVWRIEPATGALHRVQSRRVVTGYEPDQIHGMTLPPHGRELLMLTAKGVLRMNVDSRYGCVDVPALAASVTDARCVAML